MPCVGGVAFRYGTERPEALRSRGAFVPLMVARWAFFDTSHIRPDFYWSDKRVALEANGLDWYGGREGVTDTSRRTKGYEAMGITSMTITGPEIRDLSSFTAAMCQLADRLGRPLPPETERFRKARQRLREQVLGVTQARRPLPPETDDEWLDYLVSTYDQTG